jgi:hypothetical protein
MPSASLADGGESPKIHMRSPVEFSKFLDDSSFLRSTEAYEIRKSLRLNEFSPFKKNRAFDVNKDIEFSPKKIKF